MNRHGATDLRSLWELEIGLPHRFQLDLYLRSDIEGDEGERFIGEQIDLIVWDALQKMFADEALFRPLTRD